MRSKPRENDVKERERERGAREAETGRERSARDELRLAWNATLARRDAVAEQLAEAGFEAAKVVSTLPSEADPGAWQERLTAIERRLERLGPINLAAVSEFETESERKQYLDSQHADLSDALATLEDAIRKIDRETRARFKDTFEQVGRGLEAIFPRLFGGGSAYLELTGDDLLDTGVTVMARPPESETRASSSSPGARRRSRPSRSSSPSSISTPHRSAFSTRWTPRSTTRTSTGSSIWCESLRSACRWCS